MPETTIASNTSSVSLFPEPSLMPDFAYIASPEAAAEAKRPDTHSDGDELEDGAGPIRAGARGKRGGKKASISHGRPRSHARDCCS